MNGTISASTIRFPVEGMTCASCVNRIERYLRKSEGVIEATVNLATETASVRYDSARITPAGLGKAVEAAGYEARLDRTRSACAGSAHRAMPGRSATSRPRLPPSQAELPGRLSAVR